MDKAKCIACFIALFVVAAAEASPAELPAQETAALLQKLKEHRAKYPSFTTEFTEERTTRLLQKPLVTQGKLAFQPPNKFRREIVGDRPSLTVNNGQRLWIYYPSFKEAELYMMGQREFFDDAIAALTAGLNVENVSEFYKSTAFREDDGYKFVLTPKSGGVKRMVQEIAVIVSKDFVVERTEASLPKGDRLVTRYKNQQPKDLPAATFDFTPPADAHVSQPLGK